ncbi:hypothetical protein GCM10023203_51820 [Actinomycetospora straminea]|uniref:HTH luxR-type domain-containing protein n=1 Tax=Actinomycetospora straminea TaxID=663607 RepID=A0ABP9F2E9_9PSEU
MPVPLTPLVGREREVATARALLGTRRLVTVVGTGGCGKTRLALEVAGGVPDAMLVDLAPLTDPALVLPTVARALGLGEAGAQPLVTTLHRHLADRDVFLLLDNVEHVLDAVDGIADLLGRCPRLRVLATSRCPLRIPGEHLLPLHPLPVPDGEPDPRACAELPSVALFLDRVRAAAPDRELTDDDVREAARICRALDGLPLALELAAARVRTVGLAGVLADDGVRVESPRRGVPERHRTLDAAVAWSVALLDDAAATVFRRLSVFAGSWTAPVAQRVCGDPDLDVAPALGRLVEHSLVEVVPTGTGVRYRLLETLRRYAADLAHDVGDRDLVQRHAAWCAALASAVLTCPGPQEAVRIDAAQTEVAELRAALERCPPSDTATGLRTAADLYFFWDMRGYLGEGRAHLERLLARPEAADDPEVRQGALQSLGLLRLWQDDLAGARAALEDAADLAEHRGDAGGWAWTAGSLGIVAFAGGDVDGSAARVECGLAVAREAGAWMPLLRTTCGLGLVRWLQGRPAEARALLEENAELAAPTPWGLAKAGWFLGWFDFLDGDLDAADRWFRDGATAFARIGDRRSLPDCHDGAACVAAARGDGATALELLATADDLRERAGSRRNAYLRLRCDEARAATLATSPRGVTARELEVARLVAAGLTNRQIGRHLGISERTAERHTENLRAKLGVGTRAQIAAWVGAVPTPRRPDVAAVPDTGEPRAPLG